MDPAEANMSDVLANIRAIYRRDKTSCRYNAITLKMFVDPEKPHDSRVVLKGKAAEVKHLAQPLLEIWSRWMNKASVQDKQIEVLLARSVKVEEILESRRDDFVLQGAAFTDFNSAVVDYLLLLSALGDWHSARGQQLFTTTVKAHYMAHIAAGARYLNPRRSWCDCRGRCYNPGALHLCCVRPLGLAVRSLAVFWRTWVRLSPLRGLCEKPATLDMSIAALDVNLQSQAMLAQWKLVVTVRVCAALA